MTDDPLPHCYTREQVCRILQCSPSAFDRARAAGKLPFLEELKPRVGHARYRADLVDDYVAGRYRPKPVRALAAVSRRKVG